VRVRVRVRVRVCVCVCVCVCRDPLDLQNAIVDTAEALSTNSFLRNSPAHTGECYRVLQSTIYSAAWSRLYILAAYTRHEQSLAQQPYTNRRVLGCQEVVCILLHGIVCIFSHPKLATNSCLRNSPIDQGEC